MIYAWQRSPWNHIRLSCMCQTGNNKGRKAPSWLVHIQASLNLGRILLAIAGSLAGISRIRRTSACHQQLMSMATCTHASRAGWAPWRKRQPTESEWQSTPSQRPSTGSAHPNRKHHRGDRDINRKHHAEHTRNGLHAGNACSPIRNHTASPAVFYSYWSFCSPIIPFPVMRPFLWSVAAGNPIRSSWKQPNIRHLNPRQTTLGNSMELHHDPFLSFALSGYNHEWYGTVHAHHASLSFPYAWKISSVDTAYTILTLIKQAVSLYAEYVHIRIHALTHHSWLYSGGASIPDKCLPETSRQQWNEELPRGKHGTVTIRSDTWRQSKHRFHMLTAIIQRRIEQDEHDPVQFCSSTYVDIADNNRKSQANPLPAFHMLSLVAWRTRDFRSLIWHLTGMTGSSQHDHKSAITWQSGNEELANTLVPGQYQQ